MKKALLVATVQSHIAQFHRPLIQVLKEAGYEVHVAAKDNLAEKNGLTIKNIDKKFNVGFERSPFNSRNLKAYRDLKQIIDNDHYDIISCNTPVGGLLTRIAARAARKKGSKVYYTAHGFHFYEGAPKKNWLIYYPIEKYMAYLTDVLITITKEDYQLAKTKFHCNVFRAHGVGADSSKFYIMSDEDKEEFRKEIGVDSDTKVILNVGELLPNKNQKTAIAVMGEVIKSFPNSKLFIAGNGPEKESIEQIIKEKHLEKQVIMLGYTLEINKYMNMCDVLLACSFREGLPVNLMEAMLCGKPIVASKNRGHRELIQDGINGYLVDASDVDAYADCICKILTNDNNYTKNALEAVQPFTDTSVNKELKNIYEL